MEDITNDATWEDSIQSTYKELKHKIDDVDNVGAYGIQSTYKELKH